jgi:hypothetical protein
MDKIEILRDKCTAHVAGARRRVACAVFREVTGQASVGRAANLAPGAKSTVGLTAGLGMAVFVVVMVWAVRRRGGAGIALSTAGSGRDSGSRTGDR